MPCSTTAGFIQFVRNSSTLRKLYIEKKHILYQKDHKDYEKCVLISY
jgi:hypothetical protein